MLRSIFARSVRTFRREPQVGSSCSTCVLGRFDVRKLDAASLDPGPVDIGSLPMGDVDSSRAYRRRKHYL